MKAKTFFFVLFFTSLIITAQDTIKPFSFPHNVGDKWGYFFDDYSPYYVDTLQNYTVFNSVDSQGHIIIKQHAEFINPKKRAVLLADTTKYWIDTTNNYVYGHSGDYDSTLIYKLSAKKGEQWIIKDGSKYLMARIGNKWNGLLFGKTTTFMSIRYYSAKNSSDTTGLDSYYDIIADGFGLIGRGGGETLGEIHLIGAVINGTQYGNVTVVSIKKDRNVIPSDIRLYQNYPNPFNPSTTIKYSIPINQLATIKIFDILGREITTLVNEEKPAGNYEVKFYGSNLSSGIYFYTITTSQGIITKKMMLIK